MACSAAAAAPIWWHGHKNDTSRICRRMLTGSKSNSFLSANDVSFRAFPSPTTPTAITYIACSASDEPSSSDQIRSTAKIRSEVLAPFRSVRMFFYLAFAASGSLGGLIAITQLVGALSNPARSNQVPEISQGLAIDAAAVALFAFLYSRDSKARDAQIAKLSREENLSGLRLRAGEEGRLITVGSLRGAVRLVVCAGTEEYLSEAFRRSRGFAERLLERGVLVVPFATDGNLPSFDEAEKSEEGEGEGEEVGYDKWKRLWQLRPVYVSEWSKWLEEQKKLAGVSPESPVYLSLRMDGRVRGSGVGFPPWSAFVAQLPPLKGLWSGLLDGMDGRVL